MDELSPRDERGVVLDVVRRWLAGSDPEDDDSNTDGVLAEWERLRGPNPWSSLYDAEHEIEQLEVLEIDAARAVVALRSPHRHTLKRGSNVVEQTLEGPVILEKRDGRWRIVDYAIDGRRRSRSIVIGPLAEQRQPGVTVEVLGFDRPAMATQFVVRLTNTGSRDVTLRHAYALVEQQLLWASLGFVQSSPIAPGESATLLLHSGHPMRLEEMLIALAFDVRSGSHRVPFRLNVPPRAPERVVAQPPPSRLPLLRSSPIRGTAPWVVATILLAWWGGWFAIIVPVVYGSLLYLQIRVGGRLPRRLDAVRYGLDLAVIVGGTAILWHSPAIYFAVPWLVCCAVFVVSKPLGLRKFEARSVVALTLGVAWFSLLGLPSKPLPPCRLVDGKPSTIADSFVRAVVNGDLSRASRYRYGGLNRTDRYFASSVERKHPNADVVTASRHTPGSPGPECRSMRLYDSALSCYTYRARSGVRIVVGVRCDGSTWHVASWF